MLLHKPAFVSTYPNQTLVISAHVDQTVLAAGFAQPGKVVLISKNLKTGALLRQYTDSSCDYFAAPNCTVTRLATNTRGSLAWIDDATVPSGSETSVNKDDSAGFTVLDEAQDIPGCMGVTPALAPQCCEKIDPIYLTAGNGTVSWKGGPNTTVMSAGFN